MTVLLLVLFAIFQLASADFESWYNRYSKHMTMYMVSKEESSKAYAENVKYINDFNSGNHSYTLSEEGRWTGFPRSKLNIIFPKRVHRRSVTDRDGINSGCYSNYHNGKNDIFSKIIKDDNVKKTLKTIPTSVDWRSQMSSVRDQGSCGSCYAHGSVGALEGRLNIAYNNKFDLSEQQVVDCSKEYGNNGCGGGTGEQVYNYLLQNGLSYEYDYPYKGTTGTCKSTTRHVYLKTYTCGLGSMQEHLVNGPVDIAMDVEGSFMYYSSGYYDGNSDNCQNEFDELNHEMVAVGYGYNNGRLYYIVRNSWGSSWGLNGYVYVYDNVCGVSLDPEVPLTFDLH